MIIYNETFLVIIQVHSKINNGLLIISSQSLLTFQFGVNCGRHFSSEMEDSENLCYSFCCSLLAETTAASALSVIKLCCIRYAQGHFVSFLVEE